MLKFSRKVEYALTAMVFMSSKKPGELTTARELSDKFKISLELIGKILQKLAKKGLITSIQGVKGGYYLQRKAESINITEIITAIEGPVRITKCLMHVDGADCERREICPIRNAMMSIQIQLINLFDTFTLKDFQAKYSPEFNNKC